MLNLLRWKIRPAFRYEHWLSDMHRIFDHQWKLIRYSFLSSFLYLLPCSQQIIRIKKEENLHLHIKLCKVYECHRFCDIEAPQTGVFKNDWITLWVITP